MATYEQYMDAARNADAAGDEAAARQLVQAALEVRDKEKGSKEPKEDTGFKLGSLKENIFGEGEVDTIGEYIGDIIGTGAAGALRGIKGLVELPEMAGRAIGAGYDLATGAKEVRPIFDTATGRAIDAGYKGIAGAVGADPTGLYRQGESMPAQFAGTIGEFTGGAGALGTAGFLTRAAGKGIQAATGAGRLGRAGQAIEKAGRATETAGTSAQAMKTAAIAGAGSEAAGQLAEDTAWEPAARIAGALISPAAATKAFNTGNKTIEAFKNINKTKPTVESLKAEKTAAYNAVKSSGQGFTYSETQDMVNRAIRSAFNQGAYSVTDDATMAAVDLLESLRGQTVSMSQFDKIQRKLNKIYKKAPDQPEILTMKKSLDDSLALKAGSDNLVKSARAANAKYAKAKLLQKEFAKHERQAQATGTGGNVVNKYRQSIQKILDNPNKVTFFTDDEVRAMEKIVKGSVSANTLRLAGKMAPTGNGLMTYLNVVTVSINPTFLGLTVGSTVARKISEAQIRSATKKLQELVMAGGVAKKEVTRDMVMDLLTEAGGLSAQQEQ